MEDTFEINEHQTAFIGHFEDDGSPGLWLFKTWLTKRYVDGSDIKPVLLKFGAQRFIDVKPCDRLQVMAEISQQKPKKESSNDFDPY